MSANDVQVGGSHYQKASGCCPNCGHQIQHWDIVSMFNLGYLVGNATKYLFRFREKNGVQDLEKGIHYIQKQIEVYKAELAEPAPPPRPAPQYCPVCIHETDKHNEHGCIEELDNGDICQCDVGKPNCGDCEHVHPKFTPCPDDTCNCGHPEV